MYILKIVSHSVSLGTHTQIESIFQNASCVLMRDINTPTRYIYIYSFYLFVKQQFRYL